ncbi:hypothetical protein P12x_004640 [Tundrisphaera lichenicola]|uniref:hypothetical protein n=1 Tax=Tundrisphaera lichenicola TaxID=2029860 RepID=UPI003EBA8590
MSIRERFKIATLALALIPMAGCFGASDDKGDVSPLSANPEGTGRKNQEDVTETGGLGGTRDPMNPPGPGATGPDSLPAEPK